MNDIIHIKCPNDGAVLAITNLPGLEKKNVTCPVCQTSRPFTEYKRCVPNGKDDTEQSDKTDVKTPNSGEPTEFGDTGKTRVNLGNFILGRITVTSTGQHYQLRIGRQVIGRKASTSQAEIQIATGESRRMSRSHMVIEVTKMPGKGFVHCAKLFKEQCNDTFVNNVRLVAGDSIVLHHGDVLRLPDAELKFELPDGEETDHTIH